MCRARTPIHFRCFFLVLIVDIHDMNVPVNTRYSAGAQAFSVPDVVVSCLQTDRSSGVFSFREGESYRAPPDPIMHHRKQYRT